MQLVAEIVEVRSTRPLEQIDSYKREGALLMSSLQTDVLADHEPNVRVVGRRRNRNRRGWSGHCPRPLDLGSPDESIEVGDGRGLASRTNEEDVEYFCARAKGLNSTGYRPGCGTIRRTLCKYKTPPACDTGRCTEKTSPGQRALPEMFMPLVGWPGPGQKRGISALQTADL